MNHWIHWRSKLAPTVSCRRGAVFLGLLSAVLAVPACGSSSGVGSTTTLTFATVDNPDQNNLVKLIPEFYKTHPDIKIKTIQLQENDLRQQEAQDIATHGGRYDVLTTGTDNTPIWAKNGWLVDLSADIQKTSSYDAADLLPGVSKALSYQNKLYAVPFYGESSLLFYHKDVLQKAGITMPLNPTWDEVAAAAKAVNVPGTMAGICLRGKTGNGEVLAPLDTMINTFGGRWFDKSWNPQLTAPATKSAVNFYVNLVKSAGEPGASQFSYNECTAAMNGGKAAMWYDASVAASHLTGDVGFSYAPYKVKQYPGWLYAWALGISSASSKQDAAWTFVNWATNKDYIKLVGNHLGWNQVPPGTRTSTYQLSEYTKVAGAYAPVTLDSITKADVNNSTVDPVPYTGIQNIVIPEWAALGDACSAQITGAISGSTSVDAALSECQRLAEDVGKKYRK